MSEVERQLWPIASRSVRPFRDLKAGFELKAHTTVTALVVGHHEHPAQTIPACPTPSRIHHKNYRASSRSREWSQTKSEFTSRQVAGPSHERKRTN